MQETFSAKLSELSVEQLVQLSQMLGRQIDKTRADRMHINALIRAKQDGGPPCSDAAAPGALLTSKAA